MSNVNKLFSRVADVSAAYDDIHRRLLDLEARKLVAVEAGEAFTQSQSARPWPKAAAVINGGQDTRAGGLAVDGLAREELPSPQMHEYCEAIRQASEHRVGRIDRLLATTDDAASVQFLSDREFSVEGGAVTVDVIRVGPCTGTCEVSYKCKDLSAKAGHKYEAVVGTLKFAAGCAGLQINVPLLNDDAYVPVSSFEVMLTEPEGCNLDPTKSICRVTIMDDDSFPSNRCQKFIKSNKIEEIPTITILRSFFELALSTHGVGNKVKIVMVGDHLSNLYVLFKNYLTAYMINKVIKQQGVVVYITGERYSTLYLLAAMTVLPYAVLFAWARFKASLGVNQRLKGFLQGAVVRTYFNLKDDIRRDLRTSHVIQVLMNDSNDVIAKSFASVLKLNVTAGTMAVNVWFVLHKSPESTWILCLIVFAFSLLMKYEMPGQPGKLNPIKAKPGAGEKLTDMVDVCSRHYCLIRDYDFVPVETERFDECCGQVEADAIKGAKASVLKTYMPQVLTVTLAAVFLCVQGREVLEGEMTLGVFVVTLAIIKQMGNLVRTGHDTILGMLTSVKALRVLTSFLCLPVDVPERMETLKIDKQEHWRTRDSVFRAKAEADDSSPLKAIPTSDLMNIQLCGVTVAYRTPLITIASAVMNIAGPGAGPKLDYGSNKVLTGVNLSLRQGTLTQIVGPHSSGKRTIVQVLAGNIVPQAGSAFIPAHLRMVYVDRFPELMSQLTLTENLTYGNSDVSLERVEAIMRDLIDARESVVLDLLKAERSGTRLPNWEKQLTQTDLLIIHLARALVFNVEVLVLERVMDFLNAAKAQVVLRVLRKHVDERGLYEPSLRSSRRPRTVIFGSLQHVALMPGDAGSEIPNEVDSVWVMDMDGQITGHDLTR